jgi:hypothetical protein
VTLKEEQRILWNERVAVEAVYEHCKGNRTTPIYSRWVAQGRRVYEVVWMQNRLESTEASRAMLWRSFQIMGPNSQSPTHPLSESP